MKQHSNDVWLLLPLHDFHSLLPSEAQNIIIERLSNAGFVRHYMPGMQSNSVSLNALGFIFVHSLFPLSLVFVVILIFFSLSSDRWLILFVFHHLFLLQLLSIHNCTPIPDSKQCTVLELQFTRHYERVQYRSYQRCISVREKKQRIVRCTVLARVPRRAYPGTHTGYTRISKQILLKTTDDVHGLFKVAIVNMPEGLIS